MITYINVMQSNITGRYTINIIADGKLMTINLAEKYQKEKLLEFIHSKNNELDYDELVIVKEGIASNTDIQEMIDKRQEEIEANRHLMEFINNPPKPLYSVQGAVYVSIKGIEHISLPERLVEEFAMYHKNGRDFEPLINFWIQCALNIDPQAREDTFRFISDLDLKLTGAGQFLAYRNVEFASSTPPSEIDLYKKITNLYLEISSKGEDPSKTKVKIIRTQGYILGVHVNVARIFQGENTTDKEVLMYLASNMIEKKDTRIKLFGEDNEVDTPISVMDYLNTQHFKDHFYEVSDTEFIRMRDQETEDYFEILDHYETFLAECAPESKQQMATVLADMISKIPDYKDLIYQHKEENLDVLYRNLILENEELRFTDGYTGTMDIRIGKQISMNREDCDPSNKRSCSSGLHIGSQRFLKKDYFGGIGIMVLVSPRNVVSVPIEYGSGYKARVCEYIPIGFTNYDEQGNLIIPDNLDRISYKYAAEDMDKLLAKLENTPINELVTHKLFPQDITYNTFADTIESLRDAVASKLVKL